MKLEIEVNEGDDLNLLRVWREHCAVFRDHAPDAKGRTDSSSPGEGAEKLTDVSTLPP
jgi:hypothetical protein